jgi:hypothetical protein
MPVVASGVSWWLGHDHLRKLLSLADVRQQDVTPSAPARHQWSGDDQKILTTVTAISHGYFAATPAGPVQAEKLVPALLPRLVALGLEEEAWMYVHYASNTALSHFIAASCPHISDKGLLRMVAFARALPDRSDFIAAIGALAIEFAKRGMLADTEKLIDLLPVRISETPNFFRHRRVGEMIRAQLRLGHSAEAILPKELTEQLTAPDLANYPRMAISVACLAKASANTASQFIGRALVEIASSGSAKLEAGAIAYLVARTETLPTPVQYLIADWALGTRDTARKRLQRPRGDVLAIVGELAPVIEHLEGEAGIVALYQTVRQVCRWWE